MRGNKPTIGDINLELSPLVLPANLLSDEVLPEEEAQQEEPVCPYRVVSDCGLCQKTIAVHVVATEVGIRTLEHLLCGDVEIVCPACIRARRHGGQRT